MGHVRDDRLFARPGVNIEEVKTTIRRTGALPLHLRIVLGYMSASAPALLALLDKVLCPAVTHRTVELHISIVDSPTFSQIPKRRRYILFKAICASSAGTLRSLALYPEASYKIVEKAISVFTKLKRLKLCTMYWPNMGTPHILIPQLIELGISCHDSYGTRIRLPLLQTLRIYVLPKIFYVPNNDENY
jgi:hypothetical protein